MRAARYRTRHSRRIVYFWTVCKRRASRCRMALCRNSAIRRQVVTIDSCVGTGTLLFSFLCRSISITASLCAPFIALPSVRMDVILPVRVAITIARCPRWRPPIYIHRPWVVHMCCCRQSMHCPPIDNCNCTIHCSIRWNSNPRKVSNPLRSFACLTPGWLHSTSLHFTLPLLSFAVPNFLELAPSVLGKSGHAPSSAKAQSYQNVNLLHGPALSAFKKTPGGSKTYVDSYGKTHVSAHNNHLSLSWHATTMINTILTIPFNVKNVFLAALQWIWWLDQQTRLESRSTKVVLVFLSKEEDDFYVSYALSIKFSTISMQSTTTIKPINAINTSILII